ncbi:hypothetical protein KBD75_03780 [Candidatus Woesebacteria bacterium]|nr:hypothetical protein [Candidatus Woesebacteria bacterium]
MEPEIITPSQPAIEPAPPTSQPKFTPKQPPKLLYILGGVAVILFSVALGIVFFGNKDGSTPTTSNIPSTGSTTVDTTAWPKYNNSAYFYELSLPPKWAEIKHSPLHSELSLFNIEDTATLEINGSKNTQTLDEFLAAQDESSKDIAKSNKSTQVKVGSYDGYERQESWPKVGLQGVTTYVKISDMLYSFTLTPAGGKNSITNESILRDYRAALASFRLTDTSKLGLDLKEYTSKKVESLAFSAFSLKYSQTWALSESVGENSLDVSIYRNNYELTISQKAVGGAVCLFSDSPAFEGSSGDLRNKQFAEFNTAGGSILRRYFNVNAGEKSTMFFCEKQKDGPYFQTPLSVGGLVYNVPAKYDADIIKEMDEIVKSITPLTASPSAVTP